MASMSGINVPITYSVGSVDKVLGDFKKIIKDSSLENVFKLDQKKIEAQFLEIKKQIEAQMATGKIDLGQINFSGLESSIEDFARKVAFVLNETFEKEVKPMTEAIRNTTDQIAAKETELANIQKEMADLYRQKQELGKQYGFRAPSDISEQKEMLKRTQSKEDKSEEDVKRIAFLKERIAIEEKLLKLEKEAPAKEKAIENDIIKLKNNLLKEQANLQAKLKELGMDEANVTNLLLGLNTSINSMRSDGVQKLKEYTKTMAEHNKRSKETTDVNKKEAQSFVQKTSKAFSYYLVFNQLKQLYRSSIRTIQELDKAMTDAAIVTDLNREEAYKLLGTYQNLARETGLATSEISTIVVEFLKQGRTMTEAMRLAEVAAKAAKVAGISANEAVDYLTAAVNGFNLAATDAEAIADKFSAISAASATDFEELAIAMSKVAPVAYTAGVGVDFMMGVLAKGLETTREAPENIGTAFKTIFARMREVTDIGKATEDGMSLNRVEKALESIGVPLRDVSGQFRNLEDVLIDVGNKWDTLTSIEQAYIATALAGTRQQPRLLAIFNDFARTKELIELSSEATGELAFQHMEYMSGMEAALAQLKTAWEGLVMTFTDADLVIGAVQLMTGSIDVLSAAISSLSGPTGTMITGLSLLALGYSGVGAKIVQNTIFQTLNNLVGVASAKVTKKQKEKLAELNAEYAIAGFARRQAIIGEMKEIVTRKGKTSIIQLQTAALKKNTVAVWANMTAILPYILALAGVVAIIWLIVEAYKQATISSSDYADQIAKNNKELNELGNKEKELKKLIDRFDELNKKTTKTEQDFKELASLGDELSAVEFGGKEYQVSRVDVTGKVTVNRAIVEELEKAMSEARKKLLAENMNAFYEAIRIDGSKAFEQIEIKGIAEDLGYNFALAFINQFEERFSGRIISEETKNKLKDDIKAAMAALDPSLFIEDTLVTKEKSSFELFMGNFLSNLFGGGSTGGENRYHTVIEPVLNYGKMKDFIESLTQSFLIMYDDIEDFSERLSREVGKTEQQRTIDFFRYSAEKYKEQVEAINQSDMTAEQKEVALRILGATMIDQAILYDLIYKKSIPVEVVGKLSIDLSLTEIQDVIEIIDGEIKEWVMTNPLINGLFRRDMKDDFVSAFDEMFSNTAEGIESGFANFRALLDTFVEAGTMTVEEANALFLKVTNSVKTMALTDIISLLKDQIDLAKKIIDLPNLIQKGDFSDFATLIETFGLDVANSILNGNEAALDTFFNTQNQKAISQIEESIAKIESQARELGRDLTTNEINQIAALNSIIDYYKRIGTEEMMRNFRLEKAKTMLKEMNEVLSLQDKLIALGIGGKALDVLTGMSDKYYTEGMGALTKQLTEDIADLNDQELFKDGLINPDMAGQAEAQIQQVTETLNQLIDMTTEKYNREKKVIEARYKAEIDAIKNSHNERWSVIDYTNKLAEAETNVLEARRKLMAFAISGVSAGTMEQTQKDLKKLQQERQRIIEEQMVDQAEKELQKEMDDKLIQTQKDLTASISKLIEQFAGFEDILTQLMTTPTQVTPDPKTRGPKVAPPRPPREGGPKGPKPITDNDKGLTPLGVAPEEVFGTKVVPTMEELVDVNIRVADNLERLVKAMDLNSEVVDNTTLVKGKTNNGGKINSYLTNMNGIGRI